jgi:hypothetical protein
MIIVDGENLYKEVIGTSTDQILVELDTENGNHLCK